MSEFSGQGGDHGPAYIDVYGTASRLGLDKKSGNNQGAHGFEGPHPGGPFWLRGLRGELPLWLAFWGCFFFGHGIVLAFSIGSILFGVVFGLTIDPQNLDESVIVAKMVMGVVGIVMTVFVTWASISVWRSAPGASERKWGIAARGAVIAYLAIWAITIWNVVT